MSLAELIAPRLPRTARPSLAGLISIARSRRALSGLSPEQLADVGISAAEARAESRRPAWDVPANWKN
jgi:uncharacterized protein YjiS (DUF1127 family)